VPRWTHPRAEIALRPPQASALRLTLELQGCRPAPVPSAEVALTLDQQPLATTTPCPPRRYHLLLPAHTATLGLQTSAWHPRELGIERDDGPLGLLLQDIDASTSSQALPVHGALVPITPLPPGAGPVTIREWVNDHRYGHWDFWWWYLAHSGFRPAGAAALGLVWGGLALGALAWGGWGLWRQAPRYGSTT
jgi:hypothetical protein